MNVYNLGAVSPTFPAEDEYWIAPNAVVLGNVILKKNASIWFGAVLREDNDAITVGENSNVQDNSVLHTDNGSSLTIGANVTVGHMVLLHACEVQDDSFVGMHSTVLDGAVVETGAMVAAGAVVTPRKIVRKGELWAGNPAQKLRDLTEKDYETFRRAAAQYVRLANSYREGDEQKAAE